MPKSASTPSRTSAAVSSTVTDPAYTRLHITPLDPQLLKIIVPAAVLPKARGLSYHSLQTFPDKPYGFIELPSEDAQKIKKKLNGAVLRGAKIRIEPARPVEMHTPSKDAIVQDPDAIEAREKSKKAKKDKKRKRDALELPGVELEEGRKVKRGWTVTPEEVQAKKKKKEKEKTKRKGKDKENEKAKDKDKDGRKEKRKRKEPESLYTEGAECLVKTLLPPNKRDLVDGDSGKAKKKAKKDKEQGVLVHEFERNTKFATFLRTTNDPAPEQAATTFVKGQGWVNEDGTVVEDVKTTRPTAFPVMQVERRNSASEPVLEKDNTSSSDDDTSSSDESDDELDTSSTRLPDPVAATGSSGEQSKAVPSDVARPKSSSSIRSLTINIPPATPSSRNVHPLEALYKRQKQEEASTTAASQTPATSEPFTFGGRDDDIEEDDGDAANEGPADDEHMSRSRSQPPMTPFTKEDMEWRNIRSAAPTPDTAHPSRFSRIWFNSEGDDALSNLEEDDEEAEGSPSGGGFRPSDGDEKEQNEEGDKASAPADFQKIFWERRAELNRSWKKRRRLSAKEKRYRENKARADRAI